ncbi:hypothetical protein, partial [Pontiella sp.]|uniref:hypothetical protein n=1 Tax=Pontiella sp. TaxID=2837462 RepID=UPI00356A7017
PDRHETGPHVSFSRRVHRVRRRTGAIVYVLINRFGENVWVEVAAISGEVCHMDAVGNLHPMGVVLYEQNPEFVRARSKISPKNCLDPV